MFIATLVLCTNLDLNSCTIYNKLFETKQECETTNSRVMSEVLAQRPDVHFLEPGCVEVPFEQLPGEGA